MFSESFLKKIRRNKYASWVSFLNEDQLEVVFTAIGEYGCRALEPLHVLERHVPRDPVAHGRAIEALKVLSDFAMGLKMDVFCYEERIRRATIKGLAEYRKRPTSGHRPDATGTARGDARPTNTDGGQHTRVED